MRDQSTNDDDKLSRDSLAPRRVRREQQRERERDERRAKRAARRDDADEPLTVELVVGGQRVETRMGIVPCAALNDQRLSWAARGLLAYLTAHMTAGYDVELVFASLDESETAPLLDELISAGYSVDDAQ